MGVLFAFQHDGGKLMRTLPMSFVLSCVLAASAPRAAAAQSWDQPWSDPRDRPARLDLSVTAGMAAPTDWSDLVLLGSLSSASGALEQVLVRDVRVESDTVFGASVTYWRDRYGFRAGGALSRSSLTMGGTSLDQADPGRDVLAANVNTWSYDVRGVIGMIKYAPSRPVWPYVFLGVGGITYDLDRTITPPLLTFVERPGTASGNVTVRESGGRQFLLSVDELGNETVPAFDFGAGSDFRIPLGGGALGLRVEVSDHVSLSPLRVRIRQLSDTGGLTEDDAVDFGAVHEFRAMAGLVIQIGK
jgi:hypothetical protein